MGNGEKAGFRPVGFQPIHHHDKGYPSLHEQKFRS